MDIGGWKKIIGAFAAVWQVFNRHSERQRILDELSIKLKIFNELPEEWDGKELVKRYLQSPSAR